MIKVAFCSEDRQHVDAHFALSSNIVIYEFLPASFHRVKTKSFESQTGQESETMNERRLAERIEAIQDCDILYCRQIGSPAAARLINHNIFPMQTKENLLIEEAACRLQQMFHKNPPHWLENKFRRGGAQS